MSAAPPARRSIGRAARLTAAALSAYALTVGARDALAQDTPKQIITQPAAVDIAPAFSAPNAAGRVVPVGWNEMVIRVQERLGHALHGEARITAREAYGRDQRELDVTAPFVAPPHGAIVLRLPIEVSADASLFVEVHDASGAVLESANFAPQRLDNVTLVDVSDPSRVRDAVNESAVAPAYTPPPAGRGGSGVTLSVVSPMFDPATGDPILPDRAAAYSSADAVIVRSDILSRLAGAELDALATYVLGGGTLAVEVVRPEDLRHPTLVAFAGGAITESAVSSVALEPLPPPAPPVAASNAKPTPWSARPSDATQKTLVGFTGGNLHGSAYGNSAAYGLGEVHLLAFDPTQKPAVDDAWAEGRLVDLARRGFDRRASLVMRSSNWSWSRNVEVRKQLDPNESSRWAIAAAAMLLCVYALLAGPFNYARASRAGKPLRALMRLPIYAAVAFAAVVGVGFAVKGVRGRARRLTLVEAGPGMPRAVARRYRGFFTPRSEKLTVRTSDPVSVLRLAGERDSGVREQLFIDRDAARLVDVPALPWQTLVVQEDGAVALGDGISITPDGDDVTVTNRTGRRLRGAILKLRDWKFVYFDAIPEGAKVTSRGARLVDTLPNGAKWEANIATHHVGTATHGLSANDLQDAFATDAPGLAAAWAAIEDSSAGIDWFPLDAPVLIAQIDGGEGKHADSGFRIDSDRMLVRVLGYGGRP